MNDVLRNSATDINDEGSITFEAQFLDLLTTHNIYIHSPNSGHSIGVRVENTIIKQVNVSSSFGYMVLDSVVSPHD